MTAFNIVHMRTKPGCEAAYVEAHRSFDAQGLKGLRKFSLVKVGERDFMVVGEWEAIDDMAAARPAMVANLDRVRSLLEDLGGGRGVTEPWSGSTVLSLPS